MNVYDSSKPILLVQTPTTFPRADLFLYMRGGELDVRLWTAPETYQTVTFFNVDERATKTVGELLELLGVPVAVFIDR